MNSIPDIIEAFGGPAKFGKAIQITTEHAGAMKARGSINVRYWPRVVAASAEQGLGITADVLMRIHAGPTDLSGATSEAPTTSRPVSVCEAAE